MNRCKRWLALLLGAVLLLGTMSGCSGTTASDSEDGAYRKINLSMAVNGTDTQIDSLVAHHFADLVAERSGGSITIDVFPNDTLAGGNSTKGVEYIAVGAADLGAYATCVLANIEPKMSVATLPWSFTSYQEARQVIDTTGGAYYAELLDAKGITYLGSFHNGFRQLTNSKHPVTTPEDLKDLKIRVPGSAVYMGVFKALGASPTAMSWSEVFTAIQQKTIDGQENGCSVTKSAKMDEIQKYMTIWNYSYEMISLWPTKGLGKPGRKYTGASPAVRLRCLRMGPRPAGGRGGRADPGLPGRRYAGGYPDGGAASGL